MRLGVIADDFTGATDIASFLVENGMRTVQVNGIPVDKLDIEAEAVVVSLKSRSCAVELAVADSLKALAWLQAQGCQQFYFKYCSTFDSTDKGNIGPVTDALMAELEQSFTVVCPALPINGRTVYNGHLFVFDQPLNESGMRHHPVTPMLDSSVLRLMEQQSQGKSGLVNHQIIDQGEQAVQARLAQLESTGARYAVLDSIHMAHLDTLGLAVQSMPLVTGGSGLAAGLAKAWGAKQEAAQPATVAGQPTNQPTVILSGSCSDMTNRQVSYYQSLAPHFALEVSQCFDNPTYAHQVADWVLEHQSGQYAPMVYATADPQSLQRIQERYGAQASSEAVEGFFSQLAHQLKEQGIVNFIVAGGETSGTVTQSLNVSGFHIGPQIAPGVPWVKAVDGGLSLALKSGNFGDEYFFKTAQDFYHD
ncbi:MULTISPECIES: 3-oxo-tetronate kinase [unclassified Vibrio]|uniref:3-oxo-tetronate kinase n=1 Tax=Vibrio sp. HB236076 TaxID=3232307 RepID=A0AB39HEP6_9VIBR|nr:3-oxo-tetronate kinase [Vibrio sp. HB161653]MDP5254124.1 four-carbon acid sugar kinase family protein [Vibrio sp. HB161653]